MDTKNRRLKKDLWWMLPLLLIAAICLVTGFDPVGNLIGKQNAQLAINVILIIAIVLSFLFTNRRK